MKKLLLFVVAIFIVNISFSQVYIGPRLGLNIASYTGKHSKNDDSKHGSVIGMQAGFVTDMHFSDMMSLQFEFLYLQKGGYEEYEGSLGSFKTTSSYNSLEIPVLLKLTFGDKVKFYGNAGPYFNFNLGGDYQMETTIGNTTTTSNGKIIFDEAPKNYIGDDEYLDPEKYSRFDTGLYIGGGLGMKFGPGVLSFDIRYGMGFIDFNKDSSVKDADGYEAFKNKNLSLTVSYMFGG